jgi:putative ATP-dependent endonuclease of OLD family
LLFAKGVILVEGDAEEILIPLLIKKVLGVSVDELGVSIINIRSTGFENVAIIFHQNRIQRKCAILTDLDSSIVNHKILETDDDKIKKFKNSCRRSEESGALRKDSLDKFTKDNEWVDVFYAKHTFEVDFLLEYNEYEIIELIPEVYKKDAKRKVVKEELETKKSEVAGKRVLTMANNVGKGWFAILLGKYITHKTYIPDYIIDALIFATPEINQSTVKNILEYRLEIDKADELDLTREKLKSFCKNESTLQDVIKTLSIETDGDDAGLNFLKRF